MLTYHNPIMCNDRTLSVDNIVLTGHIPDPRKREELMSVLDELHFCMGAEVRHWSDHRIGRYHDQFGIALPGDVSFWLGVGLNRSKPEWGQICLDANPNKVGDTDVFHFLRDFLLRATRAESRKIKRYDLAIDLPIPRGMFHLIKDGRVYQERRHGQEWTQYLGAQPSHVGRVKLYNKQAEARLEYPLTRLELTLDPAIQYDYLLFPKVYYVNNLQLTMDHLKITDTDNYILGALLQGYGSTKQLGRREREKMERLMQHYVTNVQVSREEYAEVLRQVQSYL